MHMIQYPPYKYKCNRDKDVKWLKIAILGYGVVGAGVYKIINEQLKDRSIEVVKIWNRPNSKKKIPLWCESIEDILRDETIDCVVETLNGCHPAYKHIMACFRHGKHVVSANKAVIAQFYDDFQRAAQETNTHFLFEASVGGGIPWLNELKRASRIDSISSCSGILNGTSNYILSTMTEQNAPFADVLEKAQSLGYAEADPSADIDGDDILNKLIITSQLAFHGKIPTSAIFKASMRQVTLKDVNYFSDNGYTLKYFGEIYVQENVFEGSVLLNAITSNELEAQVNANYNAVRLTGKTIGDLLFYGQGAGQLPTANAIVQDILDIKETDYDKKERSSVNLIFQDVKKHSFVIRTQQKISDVYFDKKEQNYYHLKPLTFSQLKDILKREAIEPDLILKFKQKEV